MISTSHVGILSKVYSAFISVAFTWCVAQSVEIDENGRFLYITAIGMFFIVICKLGFEDLFLRYFAIGSSMVDELHSLYRQTFTYFFAVFIISIPILALMLKYRVLHDVIEVVYIITCMLQALNLLFASYYQANAYFFRAVFSNVTGWMSFTTICLLGIWVFTPTLNITTSLLLVLASAGCSITFILNMLFASNVTRSIELYFEAPNADVMKLFCVSITGYFVIAGGNFFSGIYLQGDDLGGFLLCARIASLLIFALTVINFLYARNLSTEFHNGNIRGVREIFRKSSIFALFVVIPTFILIVLNSNVILGFFGDEYKEFSTVLILLGAVHVINTVFGPNGYFLSMAGHYSFLLQTSIMSAFATIICYLVIGSNLGTIGLVYPLLVGCTIQNIAVSSFIFKRYRFCTIRTGF